MFQIPSEDWSRRISPLTGLEDLLKQNPISDASPQEERIPVNLVSEYTVGLINLNNVGTSFSIVSNKTGYNFNYKSIKPASNRIDIQSIVNDLVFDVNAINVANSVTLSDIGDVTNSPTTGEFLQYNGSSWVTTAVLDTFYITDGTNTQELDTINNTLTFQSNTNIQFVTSYPNTVTANWSANITDLNNVAAPTSPQQVLSWNGSTYTWENYTTISTGTVTDATNIGTGTDLYANKLGTYLRFRRLNPNSSKVLLTNTFSTVNIDVSALNIASEIKLTDLLDVSGTPSAGDIIMYNSGTSEWQVTSSSIAGLAIPITDDDGNTYTFGNTNGLRIYGDDAITTNFTSSSELRLTWSASLGQLNNVSVGSPINNQALVYDSVNNLWEPKSISFKLLGNIGGQVINNGETLKLLGQSGVNVVVTTPDTAIIKLNASITDLNDIDSPSNANQILLWDGLSYVWSNPSNIGAGEANTASNVGTLGTGVYKQKTGINLEFRNITNGSAKILQSLDGNNNIVIDANAIQIGNEIRLQDLLDVTNAPTINEYLKYDGTNWITSPINTLFGLTFKGDTGINNSLINGSEYNFNGDDSFIISTNTAPNFTTFALDINAVAQAIKVEDLGNVFGNPNLDDILIYNGTNFEFQPFPTNSFSNAWLLSGNTLSAAQTFGTINNYDIPVIANNIEIARFKTGGRFGFRTASPNSTFEVNGSVGMGNVVTKSVNYTVTIDDYMIIVNAAGGNVTITLPSAVGLYRREYVVKKIDSSTNIVYVSSASLIDDSNTYEIESKNTSIKLKSNDTQWYIF